jgi:hypothetical protein
MDPKSDISSLVGKHVLIKAKNGDHSGCLLWRGRENLYLGSAGEDAHGVRLTAEARIPYTEILTVELLQKPPTK